MAKALNEKQVEEIKVLLLENKQKIETALRKIDEDHESLSTMDLKDEGDFAAASRDYSNDIHIKNNKKRIRIN